MENAITIAFQLFILIFSVILHEVSHGFVANAMGDPTAKLAGRLTLNPLPHIDPVGSVLLPLASFFLGGFIVGWARPVPYNPNYLQVKNRELGSAIVGAAGPAANIALALIFGLLLRFSDFWAPGLGAIGMALASAAGMIAIINLGLAVFNLIPIPPLDGSKVLFALLPYGMESVRIFFERFGVILLLVFIFYFSHWIVPIVTGLFRLITGFGF
jgi:Zn-dependent protease